MSQEAGAWAWRQIQSGAVETPTKRLLLLALAEHSDPDGFCTVRQRRLAEMIGVKKRQVARLLSEFEGVRIIERIPEFRANGSQKSSEYQLLMGGEGAEALGGRAYTPPLETLDVNETSKETTTSTRDGGSGGKGDAAAVWATYVEVMKPRRTEASQEEVRVIRKALTVASVAECQTAIRSCHGSDYHMKRGQYATRAGGKYNSLTQILNGRRGKETTRERIDFWLDRGGASPLAGVASETRHRIVRAIQDVQRAFGSEDPDLLATGESSLEYLKSKGIEMVPREDGYPTFPAMRGDA